MRLPTGEYEGLEWYIGARQFWRKELQRLKFWNPSLPTAVETIRTGSNEPLYLSVEYQSPDQQALAQLNIKPYPKPQLHLKNPKTPNPAIEGSADPRRRQQPARDRRHPVPSPKALPAIYFPKNVIEHAPRDEIKQMAELEASSAKSAKKATPPAQTLYTRTVTIPLAGLRHIEIWNWIRQHTKLPDHRPVPSEEGKAYQQVARFRKEAEKDRKRVKAGIGAMKREQQELKKAREAAERMAAENV